MIAETIGLACFVLLVVVFCCVIKIYTMVKNIRPSRNERLCVDYARDNQRALPVEREPTFYFPQAERGARQHGIRNNATYSGSQAIRRQPQMNDERFGWQSKKNVSYSSAQLEFFFSSFFFTALYYHLMFFLSVRDIVFTIFMVISVSDSSQAIEEYWTRNEFPRRCPRRWTDYIKGNYMQMHGWTIVYRNALALWSFSILNYIVLYSLLWKLYF